MPAVEEVIEIRAPAAAVFEALTDPRRAAEWNPSIVRVSNISGSMGIGASWDQEMVMGGRVMRLHCQVVRWAPPHEGLIAVSGDQQGQVWTRCDPLPIGTRVTQGISFNPPPGMLGGLLGGAIGHVIQRELRATMSRQRAALQVEAGGTSGPGTS